MEMDRLSALPDELLNRILSRLRLKEAAETCLLSKRWRFVLTDLPSLSFSERTGQIEAVERFKAVVDGALANRRGAALKSLTLRFCYNESMASDVDAWVELAAKNKVQDLMMSVVNYERGQHYYSVHHSMYSNSWLKRLILGACTMAATAVEWQSMTEITLSNCFLPQQVIDNIVSAGCPALSRLELNRCRGFDRLEIGGRRFRSLNVEFHQDSCRLLEVSAPYMTDLYYGGDPATRTLRLTNVVSLQKVELFLIVYHPESEEIMTNAYQIFHAISCANILVLRDDHTLQVLSMMATNGWQIPQFKLKDITISCTGDALNTHGTTLILQSSPFLETFTMYGYMYNKVFDQTIRRHIRCDLLHLKTVKIYVNVDVEYSCKSTLAWAYTLLERAPNLEEMYIYKSNKFAPLKDFIEKFETLYCYPKSSHKPRIFISSFN